MIKQGIPGPPKGEFEREVPLEIETQSSTDKADLQLHIDCVWGPFLPVTPITIVTHSMGYSGSSVRFHGQESCQD